MRYLVSACLIAVGIIHLLPVPGALGAQRLQMLYGIEVAGGDLLILMRHRAVLFGVLGGFLLWAAFRPALQPAAFVLGFVSVVAFLWLAWSTGGYNSQLARVFAADVVALVLLVVGGFAYGLGGRETAV